MLGGMPTWRTGFGRLYGDARRRKDVRKGLLEVQDLDLVLAPRHMTHQVHAVVYPVHDEMIASVAPDLGDRGEDSEDHGHVSTSWRDGPTPQTLQTIRRLASLPVWVACLAVLACRDRVQDITSCKATSARMSEIATCLTAHGWNGTDAAYASWEATDESTIRDGTWQCRLDAMGRQFDTAGFRNCLIARVGYTPMVADSTARTLYGWLPERRFLP